jgi:hypothetical protein
MALAACAAFMQAPPSYAQASPTEELEAKAGKPLLSLPALGALVIYFIERIEESGGESRDLYWIANRGKEPVHFGLVWAMQDGRPQPQPEGAPALPPPRVHLAPGGRLCLAPPKGFSAMHMAELRVGDDTGPFIDPAAGRPAGE